MLKTETDTIEISVPPSNSKPIRDWWLLEAEDGLVYLEQKNKKRIEVFVQRCFPWCEQDHFISLKNSKGEEVKFIENLKLLPSREEKFLRKALNEQSFCFQVTAIKSVEEEFELRCWKVQTKQGERRFQTPLDVWPHKMEKEGYLLNDLYGDVYQFPNLKNFDERSRALLRYHVE